MEMRHTQDELLAWAVECFGEDKALDPMERAFRFLEEAIELAQSMGLRRDAIDRVADHVFGKPADPVFREIGGAGVSLLVLAGSLGLDAGVIIRQEKDRCIKDIDEIRGRNEGKVRF